MLEPTQQLFGNRLRTMVLQSLRLLGETYPSELAALLGARLYSIQQILASLERESVVVSRMFGRTRRVTLNPRYFAYRPLEKLLWEMGKNDEALQRLLAQKRRRPRRTGKAL